MANIVISDNRTISVSAKSLTVKEWRDFTTKRGTIDDENAVIEKCTGLKAKEIEALDYQDFRRIVSEIVREANIPLSDPN